MTETKNIAVLFDFDGVVVDTNGSRLLGYGRP